MQHLAHLRRIILSRSNIRVDFISRKGNQSRIYCSASGFIGPRHEIAPALQDLLDAKKGKAYKLAGENPFQGKPVTAHTLCITDALRDIDIDPELEREFEPFFERFPKVSVRLVPLYKSGFAHLLFDYTHVHAISVRHGYVDLKNWLNETTDAKARKRRMTLFLIMFCLGIITPSRGPLLTYQSSTKKTPSPEQSVLERIIQRMREI